MGGDFTLGRREGPSGGEGQWLCGRPVTLTICSLAWVDQGPEEMGEDGVKTQ